MKLPVQSFPISLFPKRESFLYIQDERNTERFWTNFQRDLRAAGAVYGVALDGLLARCGVVAVTEFPVVSGAPVYPQRGQLSADLVAERLVKAGFLKRVNEGRHGPCLCVAPPELGHADWSGLRARQTAEGIVLDGVREWARKLGLASYNKIAIRGESSLRPVGPFPFDLTGPSYLLPLTRSQSKPGFLVADVFCEGCLDVHEIQYFIRKARMLKASLQ